MNNNWIIELSMEDYKKRNHLMTIQNGYMGIRGYFPELFEKKDSSLLVLGVYDQVGDRWKEIINNPSFWYCEFMADGEKVELSDQNTENSRIYLDMYCSKLTMQYIWKSSSGKRLEVKHERFVCYDRRNNAAWRFGMTSLDGEMEISLKFGIDGDVIDANGPHLCNFTVGELGNGFYLDAFTKQHKYNISASNHIIVNVDGKEINRNYVEKESKCIKTEYGFKLSKDQSAVCENSGYIYTSRDSQAPVEDAIDAANKYISFDELFESHSDALKKQWDFTDVVIEGDEKAQKYMRFNLHILLTSVPKDYDYGFIPSRALSAQTYKGSIFWEVDTYAFPFYAYVHPQYARNHLLYRYKTLAHALKKAKDHGYEGAFYAWESLDTGEEATKLFVFTDVYSGKPLRNYFGDRQYHIAADVIYALWQYFNITGDMDFIYDYGAEMTLQVARFFGSLVYYKKTKDRYEILHTTCPDEYHEEVGNNHFTNKMCKFVLQKALDFIKEESAKPGTKLETIMRKINLKQEEIEYWNDVNEKLYLQEADNRMVIEEFDGYFDLEDVTVDEFKRRLTNKEEYHGYPVGPATHTQIIKQADVIQAMVMFKNDYHPVVRKASFDYYDKRCEHGSGDSPNAYGIVSAQTGDGKNAYRYFMKSASVDIESTNPAWKGGLYLGGLHTAPCGGTWQMIAFGFLGLFIDGDVIRFNPLLPKQWDSVSMNIVFKGEIVNIKLEKEVLTVSISGDNNSIQRIRVNDNNEEVIKPGGKASIKYKKIGLHNYVYESQR